MWSHRKKLITSNNAMRAISHGLKATLQTIGCVSGGFDPIHSGHINMMEAAKKQCDVLVAIANADSFLQNKKGFVFMPYLDRLNVLSSIQYVDYVYVWYSENEHVADALRRVVPHIFFNGGDRTNPNPEEDKVCKALEIKQVFGVGGSKTQSSSALVSKLKG